MGNFEDLEVGIESREKLHIFVVSFGLLMKLLSGVFGWYLCLLTLVLGGISPATGWAEPWGRSYFPNVQLTTHDGEKVRFFDDVVEGKIVVLNFIYTSCPDTCPLETAQLIKVQEILADRLGKDVFFYSITIDPENDTPEVLKEYRDQFGARWTFLTGSETDVTELRKKLGLYIEEIQDDSGNHNVNMIIGNQTTGRWMKRSPFENPYVLADQIGNWLDGWKRPSSLASYLSAPKLRDLPRGEQIFRTRCASCHTMTGKELAGALGPDLLAVTRRRDTTWILNWLKSPDQMLKSGDPIALAMYEKYNKLAMPNLRLNKEECMDLIGFMETETSRLLGGSPRSSRRLYFTEAAGTVPPRPRRIQSDADVVATMNAWVREARPGGKTNAGYLTLVNVKEEALTLTEVHCEAFKEVQIHEMARVDGLMRMRRLKELTIPAGGTVALKPGGLHLMLMGAHKRLNIGESVEVTLTFKSGLKQTLVLEVSDR